MDENFSLINTTKTKLASPSRMQAFVFMKNDILGTTYSLSIAFVSEKKSRELNATYRGKDKSTNVLSFPLSKTHGELILCPKVIQRESKDKEKNFGMNFTNLLTYLVIHGMLHLQGMDHGNAMEKKEARYISLYCK